MIDGKNLKEDLKTKAIVRICVFPNEVDPKDMPKPRYVCVSKFEDGEWVTRKSKSDDEVDRINNDFMNFTLMNSGMFVVVEDEEEMVSKVVDMLQSQI